MKITIERNEKATFNEVLIPTLVEIIEEIIDDENVDLEMSAINEFLEESVNHKWGKVQFDEKTESTTIEIKDEAICEILVIVSKLYSRFKPLIKLAKSCIKVVQEIFDGYENDLELFTKKWEDEMEYTVIRVNNVESIFANDSFAIISRIKGSKKWSSKDIVDSQYGWTDITKNMDDKGRTSLFKSCVENIINNTEKFDTYKTISDARENAEKTLTE